jgi:acetyl esterase/lipase
VARNSEDVLWDPPPPPADERLPYGREPKQFGDLRLPPGEGPFRLAIVLHGGYWKAQYNLIHTGHMCIALAAAGIATWNLEYRAVGDVGGGWPNTAEDVHLGVAFAERLRDRNRLGPTALVGHSAGGHLALLAAARARLPVVALAAVSDLAESVRRRGPDSDPARFAGPEVPMAANPIEGLPLGVLQILIHGTADETVPVELSERYAAAANGEARLIRLEGAGHFELIDPQSREWPLVLDAIRTVLSR